MCVLIAFAVLSFGGVKPWGQAVLEIGGSGLFLLWGILAFRRRQVEVYWNWLYLPLIGLGALGLVQYAFGLTAYPYATKMELLRWGACALIFFLAVESFRTTDQAKELVWFLVVLSFFVSLFAILQYFRFNGKLYWFFPLEPDAEPFGPFVNRDDFAGFVELTAPLGSALVLFQAWRREKLPLLLLFTVLPIGALVLCASRGGIIGFAFGFVLLLFLSREHHIGKRQLLGAAALVLVAGSFVVWLGVREATQRLGSLSTEEISRDRRVSMYLDAWQIFLHHPWVGTGLGTLAVVYPGYESYYDGLIVEHAHNDYLELLADTGLAGGLCGLAFVVLLFRQGFTNLQSAEGRLHRAICAGSMAACAGLLLHSLVDFNLHIPSNALILIVLASLATANRNAPTLESQRRAPDAVARMAPGEPALARTAQQRSRFSESNR
jgi:O-antigen ligase